MNKAPLMDTAKINVLPDYPETLKDRKIALFTAQRDSDHEYYMKLIKEIELECEARLKEQSVIHSMEIEQVKKETAQEIFSEIEDRFAEWNGEKYINNLVIVEYGSDHDWQALKSKYGIEG
jgi:hypothetical protein